MIDRFQKSLAEWALLLAALGGVGLAGGLLLVVWVPDLRLFAGATLLVAGGLLIAAVIASLSRVIRAISSKRSRLSWLSIWTVGAVFVIAIVVNVLASQSDLQWDLTATRQFEVSPQAVKVLGNLSADVEVTGFVVTTNSDDVAYGAVAAGLLQQFERVSAGRLKYQFVDPELEPSLARALDVNSFPALIFDSPETGLRSSIGSGGLTERDLLTALLRVSATRQHKAYFLAGHGERSLTDLRAGSTGLGLLARALRADGIESATLNLASENAVPADASLLVIAAPKSSFEPQEINLINSWMRNGGSAILMSEPSPKVLQSMSNLFAFWGVEQVAGTVVDPERSSAGDSQTLVVQRDQYLGQTSITEGQVIVQPLGPTLFPGAAAFRPTEAVAARIVREESLSAQFETLVSTSDGATVSKGNTAPVEPPGPQSVHLLVQASAPPGEGSGEFDPESQITTIAMLGDTDFVSNRYIDNLANRDFFLNVANWLLRDESLISIRPKQEVFRPLVLTMPEFDFVRYVSWFLLPAGIAAMGVFAWWRRR